MSLEQSLKMLHEGNRSLQIAGKEVEMAESEHRRTSSFWYPMLNVTGAYVHMSNPIEVKQPLNQFTDPAKDFIHSVLPDDQLISSILDKIGSYSLRFPLAPQNVSTIDANLTWPIFAGGKPSRGIPLLLPIRSRPCQPYSACTLFSLHFRRQQTKP